MERNYWLDTLRGFASLWVVIFHFNEVVPFEANFYTSFAKYGWLGMPIFFIVSGYCINMVTDRLPSPQNFIIRRIFRIFPPYYASIFIVLLIVLIRKIVIGVNDVAPLPTNIFELLATFTLMTKPATSVQTVNWVYWSLTYEIIFYLLVTVTLICRKFNYLFIYLITILCFVLEANELIGGNNRLAFVGNILFLKEWWLLFSAGMALYGCKKYPMNMILLLAISLWGIFLSKDFPVFIIAFITLLSIFLSNKFSFLNKEGIFSRIGEFSYSLYLIHVPIGIHLLLKLRNGVWIDHLLLHIIYDIGVLTLLIFFSRTFYFYIEKPSIKIGKNILKKYAITK